MSSNSTSAHPRAVAAALLIMLASVALMRLYLNFTHEANWDEYLNLSMVYDHERGELSEVLQTGFIHLLGWATEVSINEADQIVAARHMYLVIALITSFAIYMTARRLFSNEAALFVVLLYWGFSYNLIHAVSLRTDPLAACAMMCALAVLVKKAPRTRDALLAGFFVGLAGFFTIKAAFYLPAVVAVPLIRHAASKTILVGCKLVMVTGVFAFIIFLALSGAHASTLNDPASPLQFLARTTGSTLGSESSSVFTHYLSRSLGANLIFFVLIYISFFIGLTHLRNQLKSEYALVALALFSPILTFFVYRDSYPYFYPFILAPVAIIGGYAWDELSKRCKGLLGPLASLAICLSAFNTTVTYAQRPIFQQRELLAVIHELFPNQPPYIDGRSMVSSFPKQGLFMSRWGMQDYRQKGTPIMAELLETHQPQFLLANIWSLQLEEISAVRSDQFRYGLMFEDMKILQENFIRFWGPLFLPGKTIMAGDESLEVSISGTYRLVSEHQISLDGSIVSPGEEIFLESKTFAVSSKETSQLILSLNLPDHPPTEGSIFGGF